MTSIKYEGRLLQKSDDMDGYESMVYEQSLMQLSKKIPYTITESQRLSIQKSKYMNTFFQNDS